MSAESDSDDDLKAREARLRAIRERIEIEEPRWGKRARERTVGACRRTLLPERAAGDACAVDGCERPVSARGLCTPHYNRVAVHGSPTAARCNTCKCVFEAGPEIPAPRLCATCQPRQKKKKRLGPKPYGATDAERAVLQRVAHLVVFDGPKGGGISLRKIAVILSAEGVPTPTGGDTWRAATLAYVLHNTATMPIIGPIMFHKVRAKLASRNKRRSASR